MRVNRIECQTSQNLQTSTATLRIDPSVGKEHETVTLQDVCHDDDHQSYCAEDKGEKSRGTKEQHECDIRTVILSLSNSSPLHT